MRTATILAVAASTLASASPFEDVAPPVNSQYDVTKFVYGCSAGCHWSFNVTVEGEYKNHPELQTPVTCSGGLDENQDYKKCDGAPSETQEVAAYIDKATNLLKVRYTVKNLEEHNTYKFYGDKRVYASTSADAKLQQEDFAVPESVAGA
ncbi:uncharacterized protein MYCFIDRAFT_209811 [Pseudocercospora fijiensis CIRAD86]|uniref:Uncharacterized protein n=1 Tax=Pseudocercospora fijiensis (strain CIRAD86) TaxID=383855 RepID=N1QBE2_PSEFD|nr:uncharacterized protein MYCFIDRAFT_209811 [Pseudocercospora fijiensis CIRAD86]EME88453.1 hypothetical protein MYCFIDRAFT_209811 [Pseudocercospora fijiensis CIRAD86]